MKALRLAKEYGNLAMNELRSHGWLDTSRNVIRNSDSIELPIINNITQKQLTEVLPKELANNFEFIHQSTPSFKNFTRPPIDEILKKSSSLPGFNDEKLSELPTKWELLGDVLILRLPTVLEKHWRALGKIYAEILGAKSVLRRFDKIHGIYRKPGVELIFGDNTETIHIENKVKFSIDPLKVMFSSGNIDERIRISTAAEPKETVVDMFAGIGYLCLPLAVHSKPKKIIACELNPVAYQYLTENIELNHVENIVQPILGDNRKSIQPGIAHRILMGYIKTEHSHRHAAFKILKPSGGVIHFHDVGFKDTVVEVATQKIQESLVKSGFDTKFQTEVYNHYIIKSYGPKLSHVVLNIRFNPILEDD